MNFWLVEVLESALESRHDFTLGSECGFSSVARGVPKKWILMETFAVR